MAKKRLFLASLFIAQLCILIAVGGLIGYLFNKQRMTPVLKIGEAIFVQEQEEVLKEKIRGLFEYQLVLEDQVVSLYFGESQKVVEAWIAEQYMVSPSYDLVSGIVAYLNPNRRLVVYPYDLLRYDDVVVELINLKSQLDTEPTPASLTHEHDRLSVVPAIEGRSLNIEKTWQRINEATRHTAEAVFDPVPAVPGTDDLAQVQDLLADFTTFFNSREIGRTTNIRLSTEALNGVLLAPDEVLSFNLTVGERAAEKGYLPADIYVDNRLARDLGGGVCQTASTLYQAVLQANLKIVERHRHTLPVNYVPANGDATVSYGILDFKFKNDTSSYIYLRAETGDNYLRIRIYGKADAEHPVVAKPMSYPEQPEHLLHK